MQQCTDNIYWSTKRKMKMGKRSGRKQQKLKFGAFQLEIKKKILYDANISWLGSGMVIYIR